MCGIDGNFDFFKKVEVQFLNLIHFVTIGCFFLLGSVYLIEGIYFKSLYTFAPAIWFSLCFIFFYFNKNLLLYRLIYFISLDVIIFIAILLGPEDGISFLYFNFSLLLSTIALGKKELICQFVYFQFLQIYLLFFSGLLSYDIINPTEYYIKTSIVQFLLTIAGYLIKQRNHMYLTELVAFRKFKSEQLGRYTSKLKTPLHHLLYSLEKADIDLNRNTFTELKKTIGTTVNGVFDVINNDLIHNLKRNETVNRSIYVILSDFIDSHKKLFSLYSSFTHLITDDSDVCVNEVVLRQLLEEIFNSAKPEKVNNISISLHSEKLQISFIPHNLKDFIATFIGGRKSDFESGVVYEVPASNPKAYLAQFIEAKMYFHIKGENVVSTICFGNSSKIHASKTDVISISDLIPEKLEVAERILNPSIKILCYANTRSTEKILSQILDKNYTVTICDTYKKFEKAACDDDYSLYIMEGLLDTELNFEMLSDLSKISEKPIPIIFLTKTWEQREPRLYKLNVYQFLEQPFHLLELHYLIKKAVKKKKKELAIHDEIKNQLSSIIGESFVGNINQVDVSARDENNVLSEYDVLKKFGLSEREIEVTHHVLEGKTYKQVAFDLDISVNTVKTNLRRSYKKCSVQSAVELSKKVLVALK